GPAFADVPLLDLAARWCGEPAAEPPPRDGWLDLAVCGAHLSGLPLNHQLLGYGGRPGYRGPTARGCRPFGPPRPRLPRPRPARAGDGPGDGIAVQVWSLPQQAVGALLATIPAPLGLGRLTLDDGCAVPGFIAGPEALQGTDISGYGGWRAYVDPGPHPA